MENLSKLCAVGTKFKEEMITINDKVSIRVITFAPASNTNNPAVVFVAGWISLIVGWKKALQEMTKDFPVYYIETREKISSHIIGKVEYGVETIGKDIVTLISRFKLEDQKYILLGSSLGATAILDCCKFLKKNPLCLVLIAPNAVFRVPKMGMAIIRIFPPRLYLLIKPVVKWYLKTFRLDTKSDYAQYEKYCNALDAANPWKLKKAVLALAKYKVWELLGDIEYPTLIIGASKDVLHEPENIKKMVSKMKRATYLDMETNALTHSENMVKQMRKYIAKL